MSLPSCDADVESAVDTLRTALDAIRPGLVVLVPDLVPADPAAFYATDGGVCYGIRVAADLPCVLVDGTPVVIRDGQAAPGTGFATRIDGQDVLVVGTHDEAREGGTRSAGPRSSPTSGSTSTTWPTPTSRRSGSTNVR